MSGASARRRRLKHAYRAAATRALGETVARGLYDYVSAGRELAWNSLRRRALPSFWRQRRADQREAVRRVAVHGEFGDAILALPWLYNEARRRPDRRLVVVIKGPQSGLRDRTQRDPFAEAGPRLMAAAEGASVNFLLDFWRRVPFLALVEEGHVGDGRFAYWQAQPGFALSGKTLGPADYRPFLPDLFHAEDRERAESVWGEAGRPLRVAVHARRSAGEIAALVGALGASSLAPRTAVALLGSRRHEAIPALDAGDLRVLDLTDNYERGLPIMPLLQIVRSADVFVGGRGGFELFALAAGVPALTVFDEDGWWERRRLWPARLWEENPLGVLTRARDFNAAAAFVATVAPWLRSRLGMPEKRPWS